MREFRQNTSYKEIMKQTAEAGETEGTESGAGGHGNRYSLPYGLCESVGINTYGMTPREAWDAWMSKTGRTKEDAEREHWGKEASEKNAKKSPASGEKNKENELNATDEQRKIIDKISKENKNTSENVRKEDIKTKDDLISYIKYRHGVELKNENIPFLNDNKKRLYTEIPRENRNSILNDLKQQGFSVEEHNKGYYWIDLPIRRKK